MEICIYIPTGSFFVGGGEIVPLTQARYLTGLGHRVRVAVLKVDTESEYFSHFKKQYPNIVIDYLDNPIPGIENKNLDHKLTHILYFELAGKFASYCISNHFELVITHYSVAAVGLPSGIPQILYLHGTPSQYEPVNEAACNSADRLVAVSQSVKDGWLQMFPISKQITVIRNGIDEQLYQPDSSAIKDIDILYLGRLIEIKGVQHLIEAVHITKDHLSPDAQIHVAICGDGPFKTALIDQARNLGLENLIEFRGYVQTSELPSLYNRSKVTVFPSFAKEGVLTTMLEAASSGCCIITSDCCGMAEFITDSQNGLLFTPQNSTHLAEKITLALTDEPLRSRLGQAARSSIVQGWTWNHAIARLNQIIEDLHK